MSQVPQRDCRQGSAAGDGTNRRRVEGFDFTLHMRRLCDDMVARVDALRHIDMEQVALGFSQTRKATRHGMYASLTAMRFAGGCPHTIRRGRKWTIQRLVRPDGREMLYILSFYLPRFLDLSFRQKLVTVMHELWHIGPRFDGDLRRFGERCYAHGASKKAYDARVGELVDCWLGGGPPETVSQFLRHSSDELLARYGRIFGRKIRAPKLLPVV